MLDKTGVAIYCRLARKDRHIMKQQKAEMLAYAKGQGYENVTVYSDNGYSGTNFNRPAFMQMESDIAVGRINTIVCKNISRIGRGYIEVSVWLDKIKQDGITIISVNDGAMDSTFINVWDLIRQAYQEHRSQQDKLLQCP